MNVNVELKKIISEIYSYVLTSQVKYCKFDMKHPFLEATFLNVAIFHRSLKKYGESLMMFKRLEQLQKQIYGEMNICLLYTYKNIGTCYLGIGQSEQARKYFRDCIELIEGAVYDCDKPELKIKDKEEIATLNQNMYLTHVSEKAYDKALECSKKSI